MSNDLQGRRHLPEDILVSWDIRWDFCHWLPYHHQLPRTLQQALMAFHPPKTCVHMHSLTRVQTYVYTHVNVDYVCSCHSSLSTSNHSASPTRGAQHPPHPPTTRGPQREKTPAGLWPQDLITISQLAATEQGELMSVSVRGHLPDSTTLAGILHFGMAKTLPLFRKHALRDG